MSQLSPVLMVQGTQSSVGKSLLTTALCRWFARRGYKVAPFKAQNMALNAGVTQDGGEIGRAQMIQAEAAGVEATVDMNPLLLKPEGDRHSQLVLLGKPVGSYNFASYHEEKPKLRQLILKSLDKLRRTHDLVIVEGAGSPAEVNLKAHDLVNMFVARSVSAAVLLVGDIDRGGIFASLLGTLDLLDEQERQLIIGLVVNKFRGDRALFADGIRFLEEKSARPVLGLLPYLRDHGVAEEDSLGLDARHDRLRKHPHMLDIAIIRLPRISNYDEFLALEQEEGVHVAYITDPFDVHDADLLIIPGSKATIQDLKWLRQRGFADAIKQRVAGGAPTLAICGGYQMMGLSIEDHEGVEAPVTWSEGLGLLPITTHFSQQKTTAQRKFKLQHGPSWMPLLPDTDLEGYEIHMGQVKVKAGQPHVAAFHAETTAFSEGLVSENGCLLGTLVHGLFDNAALCSSVIHALRLKRGLATEATQAQTSRVRNFDKLADMLDEHMDMKLLIERLGLDKGSNHVHPL